MRNTENNAKNNPNPHTQPNRVKQQQRRALAIGLCLLAGVSWVLYAFLSNHSSSSANPAAGKSTRVEMANPTTHVDDSRVWVERTENELAKTQKTTEDLQQQLQLLGQQKAAQESASQTQTETLQALQLQVKALQEKLTVSNSAATPPSLTPAPGVTPSPAAESSLSPLRGVNDDILALSPNSSDHQPIITPSKTPESYVPSGTFVRAVMLGGADASAGVTSQSSPTPVLLRLLDAGTLPNHHHSHLKDCVATAAAIGDISSERGQMRLERLSCVSPNHSEVIELPVEGTVFGPEGKNGVRGVPLWREGALLKRAFVAGTLSGFSQGIASQYTTTSVSPTGTVSSVNNADIFKFGAAQGVSNAMDKIADYNIRRADQYHPVIQLSAGTVVDIVFLKGFYLDGQKHDNEKEAILPPFEQTIPFSSATATKPSTKMTVTVQPASPVSAPTVSPSVAPLPLTAAQINALTTKAPANAQFFK